MRYLRFQTLLYPYSFTVWLIAYLKIEEEKIISEQRKLHYGWIMERQNIMTINIFKHHNHHSINNITKKYRYLAYRLHKAVHRNCIWPRGLFFDDFNAVYAFHIYKSLWRNDYRCALRVIELIRHKCVLSHMSFAMTIEDPLEIFIWICDAQTFQGGIWHVELTTAQ